MAKPERLYLAKIQTIFGNRSPTMPTGVVGLFALMWSSNMNVLVVQAKNKRKVVAAPNRILANLRTWLYKNNLPAVMCNLTETHYAV